MTDQEKVEKLAKWKGWQLFERNGFKRWATLKGEEVAPISWNPLTNIADAWMLVENVQDDTPSALGDDYDEGHCILVEIADIPFAELKSSEVASAITSIIMERVK